MPIVGPLRVVNVKAYRVDKRQENTRLTKLQRDDLDEALSPEDLPKAVVEKVEDALDRYRARRRTHRQYDSKDHQRSQLRRLAAARALFPLLGPLGERVEKPLQRFIDALDEDIAIRKHAGRHRPTDEERLILGLDAAWALDDAGLPLAAGRPDASVLVRVLQLVLGWADEVDGHAPRRRINLFRFASDVVRKYKPWRKKVEARMRAYERWWTNYERRRDRSRKTRDRAELSERLNTRRMVRTFHHAAKFKPHYDSNVCSDS